MVKIAVATEGESVASHYGQCRTFNLLEIDGGEIRSKETLSLPERAMCGDPEYLSKLGASVVIAGGIGVRAQEGLAAYGIQVYPGVQGSADAAIRSFMAGSLVPGESSCDHSGCGEGHSHEGGSCAHHS